jgi:hypothetical protein
LGRLASNIADATTKFKNREITKEEAYDVSISAASTACFTYYYNYDKPDVIAILLMSICCRLRVGLPSIAKER